MQLQLSTWQEVEDYLGKKTTIILPIGSTEQHGPSGFIGTDALCPEALAKAAGDACDVMVGPTFALGMAQHHLAFAGTITLRPSTIIAMLQDTVTSLAQHGFREFYFLNGHGGNMATLAAAFSEIHAAKSMAIADEHRPSVRCKQRNWWDGNGFQALSKELYGSQEGSHATCSEISLTYYLHPDHVKDAEFDPPVAANGRFHDAVDFKERFADGRMGSNPSLCSVEDGERIFKTALKDITEDIKRSF